jgi:hypothetical protein
VWHASAAGAGSRLQLRGTAIVALYGVGDSALGQWEEWTGSAYHIRRRLTPAEQELVGPAVDIRNTQEAIDRWQAVLAAVDPRLRNHPALSTPE